jgi:CheY-like chemotaxis protein
MTKPTLNMIIADDDNSLREMNARILPMAFPDYDIRVTEAVDGDDFYAKGMSTLYDLVITDINMPGKSGPAVLKELRSMEQLKDGKALVMTGADTPENVREAVEAGFPYLPKPYTIPKIMQALRSIWPEYSPQPQAGTGDGSFPRQ